LKTTAFEPREARKTGSGNSPAKAPEAVIFGFSGFAGRLGGKEKMKSRLRICTASGKITFNTEKS
jgi:hypothetical protein